MSSRLAFQTQLASIMEVLANAAVAEICKLVDDDYAVVSLQMSQCQKENKALKRKLHLLELKMARGTAERRLRESAFSSGRLRVQISGGDNNRLRETSADGVFEQQNLWPHRALTENITEQPQPPTSKSPDVQFVDPEPVIVKEETKAETKEEEVVHLIEDNDVMDQAPHAADGPKLGQIQPCPKTRTPTPPRPLRRPKSATNRRVESVEEPDLVLVKVEEAEDVRNKPNGTSLIIQEGLVESSTDDFKAELPFTEASQISASQVQESSQGLSEVSFGSASLWTSDNLSSFPQDPNLPGPSSQMPVYTNASLFSNIQVSSPILTGQLPPEFLSSNLESMNILKKKRAKTERKKNCACDFCGKGFSSPANLESHLRTHTGEKPFACNICGKLFSQFWNMKIHKNIHTGERPYQCSVCNEKFSDPSNLKKHEKRHSKP